MAVQITTGAGSLVALGLGVGDVYSLITLGQRIGNWWTAVSGDKQFLALLDQDEFEILRRKGLIDLATFNKRWRKQIRLLANGEPLSFQDSDAESVVEEMGRFTAVMVCIVAALDSFARMVVVKRVLKSVLIELLRTTESGEDLLNSQYASRLNAWRSSACLRGLFIEAQTVRQALIDQGVLMSGYMPVGETHHIVTFLVWLLSKKSTEFTTASSDIAGLAVCLSSLGIDIITVEGKGFKSFERPCRLIYSEENILSAQDQLQSRIEQELARYQAITVSIVHPEECISVFPTEIAVHNRCRSAWKLGQQAAQSVYVEIMKVSEDPDDAWQADPDDDLYYTFVDRGTPCSRVSNEIYDLATAHAPIVNDELLKGLERCFERERPELLSWVYDQCGRSPEPYEFNDPDNVGPAEINVFCVFQAFFMGYYYAIFFRMVDTSSLKLQTVEGTWGFCSSEFIFYFRNYILSTESMVDRPKAFSQRHQRPRPATEISRQGFVAVLTRLFLGHSVDVPISRSTHDKHSKWCIGVVAKRTLVINSLLGKCGSMDEIGKFTMLDVDVGGIPRNPDGLVRPGYPDGIDMEQSDSFQRDVAERSPPADVTLHIEADWDADPEATFLCVRYKGRRITTISPTMADLWFWRAIVEPIGKHPQKARTLLERAIPADITHLLMSPPEMLISADPDVPVLVQAYNRPRLRYSTVALYGGKLCHTELASDCIEAAQARGMRRAGGWQTQRTREGRSRQNISFDKTPLVIVAGLD